MPVVSIRSAVCVLGGFPALAGADLDVSAGETLLLAGPNGAGKTTLLRLMAGLVSLHSGDASVLGVDLRVDRRSHRRKLALVGHDTFCYDDLTVEENLSFAARAAGRSEHDASTAIDRLDLGPQRSVVHGRLSEGQRRRLAIAVALARAPELLLLDEPHAGLDATGRDRLDEIVRSGAAEGRTTVVASHELDRARLITSREVEVVGGQVVPVVSKGKQVDSAPRGDLEPAAGSA